METLLEIIKDKTLVNVHVLKFVDLTSFYV
jgi:hypothetical protein